MKGSKIPGYGGHRRSFKIALAAWHFEFDRKKLKTNNPDPNDWINSLGRRLNSMVRKVDWTTSLNLPNFAFAGKS